MPSELASCSEQAVLLMYYLPDFLSGLLSIQTSRKVKIIKALAKLPVKRWSIPNKLWYNRLLTINNSLLSAK